MADALMRAFQDRPSPAPLTATVMIGVGTLGSLAMSVIANKIYALVLGPSGVGVAALFLATLSVGGLTASLGLGTSIVQAISAAISSEDHGLAVAIERVGRFVVFGVALACGVATFGFRDEIARVVFGTPSAAPFVGFVAPALALTAMAYVETGILTGHHRVGTVTLTNVLTAGVGLVSGAIGVLTMGLAGLPPAMLVTTAVHYGFARMRAGATRAARHPEAGDRLAIAKGLIRLGLPAVASQLASIGIQLAVSVWVLIDLGAGSVGLYRAAATISLGYLTVFLSALTYDFLPRAARASVDDVGGSIDRLMRLVLGLGLPLVVGLFASGTWILQLLYTDAFIPALSVLQWYLVGDLLRIPAWGLSFALLARSRTGWFLALEAVVAASMLISLPVGLQLAGLEGIGIGYAVTQALYLASAWWVTSRLAVTTPGRLQGVVVLVALVAALSIVAELPLWIRGAVFGSVAIAISAVALPRLYRLHRAGAL